MFSKHISVYDAVLKKQHQTNLTAHSQEDLDEKVRKWKTAKREEVALRRLEAAKELKEASIPTKDFSLEMLDNGAVSIGTLGRLSPERGCFFPEADVSLKVGRIPRNIGIFGHFKSLTLVLDQPPGEFRIWAQDLAGDGAVDITSKVLVKGNTLVFPGGLIKTVGLSAATPGDLSDPALVVEISVSL
jgi:hypothetical protein